MPHDAASLVPITSTRQIRIGDADAARPSGLPKGDELKKAVKHESKRIKKLQSALYADGRYAILVVLQGRDASGKDVFEATRVGLNYDKVIANVERVANLFVTKTAPATAPATARTVGHERRTGSSTRGPKRSGGTPMARCAAAGANTSPAIGRTSTTIWRGSSRRAWTR